MTTHFKPTSVFLPGESHGQRNLAGYMPLGCKDSDTTEVTQHACTYMSIIALNIMFYWDLPGFCFLILLCFFWELKAPPIPGLFFRYSVFTDLGIAPHPSNYFLNCWEVSWGQKRRKKKYLFTTGMLWMDKAGISQVLLWRNNLCLELL